MTNSERVFWRRRQIFSEQRPPPRQENPYFPEKRRPEAKRRRVHLVSIISLLLCAGFLVYGVFFSPFFRVDYVTAEGNRFVPTETIVQDVQSLLNTKIAWVIPRRTLTLLSSSAIEHQLRATIGAQQAIETLRVEKHFPSHIHILLTERTPSLVYENGGVRYLVDRAGILAKFVQEGEHLDPSFPTLIDQTTRPMVIGKQVLSAQYIDALFSMQQQLHDQTDVPIDFFYIPPVECKKFAVEPEEGSTDETTNGNVNEVSEETNTNRSTNLNTNTKTNSNTNATNRNTANTNRSATTNGNQNANTAPEPPPCDKGEEVLKTLELRVKSTEDWEIYARIDDSIATQVTRLKRVLTERHLDRTMLDYIDLRFGESVIIK